MGDYFKSKGLGGLMSTLVDPGGKNGLKKLNSAWALLDFYSEQKGLKWFDWMQLPYLTINGRRELKVIYKKVA